MEGGETLKIGNKREKEMQEDRKIGKKGRHQKVEKREGRVDKGRRKRIERRCIKKEKERKVEMKEV